MKKKAFFYRIEPAELMNFATDPEGKGMSLLRFAKELQNGKSDIPFIQGVIDEAHRYIENKKRAGSAGGKAKASSAKAKASSANECNSSALAESSTPLASSSSSSSTVTEDQHHHDDGGGKFLNMKEINALCTKHLGWNPVLTPGRADQIRPLTQIFKDDVVRGFEAASSNGKQSVYYVIAAANDKKDNYEDHRRLL